ncbi:MAG: mechanosensitive ion channel family protein [Candidatus Izemoplasmatales bacterium]|jgi:small conductance mechanosensitive channel
MGIMLKIPFFINIGLAVLIAVSLVAFFFFQRRWIKNNEENVKHWRIVLLYFLDFLLFVGGIIGILLLLEFDFSLIMSDMITDLEGFLLAKIGAIIGSVVVIFIAMAVLKLSKLALIRVGKKPGPTQKRKKTLAKVTHSIIKYIVGILEILIILSMWGVNIVPALAGLGIMGLVIGLGAQKFINDLIAGVFIIFEQHFDVGDIIEVGGFKGEVTDIGLKTTRIRNWRGEVKILANGSITNVSNFSRNPSIAIVDFGIAYHENVNNTIQLLQRELPKIREELPQIIDDPQVVGVINLGSSSVDIRVTVKTLTEQHYGVERQMRRIIKNILDENHIEIPFPQVVVHEPKNKAEK